MPVIEDIKDVIRKVIKEDEIPITEIPIDVSIYVFYFPFAPEL